jgi:ABC-2 type transport system ATP-binding protein
MLLGLARASRGRMRLFGEPVPQRLPQVIGRIGAVVEQPKFVPTFTGRKNLALLAHSIGVPTARVDAALDRVGLAGRDNERYKGYSLGMKQRLAIAATLLKSPDLLILDEPTNGLDPSGIRDIRNMIRELGERGVTVLLSSHILAEVQQVCGSVSIIGNGRLLASGPVDDLVGAGGAGTTLVRVADPATAAGLLRDAGHAVTVDADGALQVEGVIAGDQITRLLAERGLYVSELTPVRQDLESVFLQLTQDVHVSGPIGTTAGVR